MCFTGRTEASIPKPKKRSSVDRTFRFDIRSSTCSQAIGRTTTARRINRRGYSWRLQTWNAFVGIISVILSKNLKNNHLFRSLFYRSVQKYVWFHLRPDQSSTGCLVRGHLVWHSTGLDMPGHLKFCIRILGPLDQIPWWPVNLSIWELKTGINYCLKAQNVIHLCVYHPPTKLREGNVISRGSLSGSSQGRGSHVTITYEALNLTKQGPPQHVETCSLWST